MTTVFRYLKGNDPLPSMKISKRKVIVRKEDLDNWLDRRRRG